jgi:hypothetical protein
MEGRDEKGKFLPGNLFSLGGYNSGRPRIYTDPQEMYNRIAEYLKWEDDQKGKELKGVYTLEGCALYLGFASVQSMYDYEKRESEFSYVINKYRLFLVQWNVQKLYWGGTYMGAQFWLRNHGGYSDESTVNQKQTITTVNPTILNSGVPLAGKEEDIKE